MTLKELLEKRKTIADRMAAAHKKAADESRSFTAEEKTAWDADDAEYKKLSGQIEIARRAEEIEVEQRSVTTRDKTTPGLEDRDTRDDDGDAGDEDDQPNRGLIGRWSRAKDEQRQDAIRGWIRRQSGMQPTRRQRAALDEIGIADQRSHLDIPLLSTGEVRALQRMSPEQRLQQTNVGPSGGFTVAPGFMARAEVAMLAFGGLRAHAEIIRTDTGAELPWPTADDTSNEGEQIGEGEDGTEQDVVFEQQVWNAYKFSSKPLKVSRDLIEDSAFDIESMIENMLGERIGRRTARGYAAGTGAATIRGLSVAAQTGVTAASATAVTAGELFNLQHSVDIAYRSGAMWLMNDSTFLAIRKLTDGEGNYLLQRGIAAGDPGTLLGNPVVIDNNMPSMASGAAAICFGQLRAYKIRDVRTIRIVRMNERYADEDAVGFVGFFRTDGDLLDAGTGPVKKLVMA